MSELSLKVERLREQLLLALEIEEELAARLRSQSDALLAGAPDDIMSASRALDSVYSELKRVSCECREALCQLLDEKGLPDSTVLSAAMQHLPREQVERIDEPTRRLRHARREARDLSMKNASIARSSLDAIATVRSIVSASIADAAPKALRASLSRLDSHA